MWIRSCKNKEKCELFQFVFENTTNFVLSWPFLSVFFTDLSVDPILIWNAFCSFLIAWVLAYEKVVLDGFKISFSWNEMLKSAASAAILFLEVGNAVLWLKIVPLSKTVTQFQEFCERGRQSVPGSDFDSCCAIFPNHLWNQSWSGSQNKTLFLVPFQMVERQFEFRLPKGRTIHC